VSILAQYTTGNYTFAKACLTLERNSIIYTNNIIFMIMMVVASYSGFYISPQAAPGRITLAFLCTLIVINNMNAVYSRLPDMQGQERVWLADFMLITSFFIFAALVEYGFVNFGQTMYLLQKEKADKMIAVKKSKKIEKKSKKIEKRVRRTLPAESEARSRREAATKLQAIERGRHARRSSSTPALELSSSSTRWPPHVEGTVTASHAVPMRDERELLALAHRKPAATIAATASDQPIPHGIARARALNPDGIVPATTSAANVRAAATIDSTPEDGSLALQIDGEEGLYALTHPRPSEPPAATDAQVHTYGEEPNALAAGVASSPPPSPPATPSLKRLSTTESFGNKTWEEGSKAAQDVADTVKDTALHYAVKFKDLDITCRWLFPIAYCAFVIAMIVAMSSAVYSVPDICHGPDAVKVML